MKEKLGIALALAAMFQFSNLSAAPIDREIAILASEQSQGNSQTKPEEKVNPPTTKTKKELEAEEKSLEAERREEEKRLKEEQKAARKTIEEGKREKISTTNDKSKLRQNSSEENSNADKKPLIEEKNDVKPNNDSDSDKKKLDTEKSVTPPIDNSITNKITSPIENPVTEVTPPAENISSIPQEIPLQNSSPTENPVGMPNPIKSYSSFEEVSEAVGFTPLYIPKKSGYTISGIMSIDNRIAEIRYGRRWEPEVSLAVRTYKRAPNEELQDISGINGAKWRVDDSSGSTVYLAKLNDNDHAAAWAVGDFTFSAYVQNLSFAAFYALVVEELVDLSNHYYIA